MNSPDEYLFAVFGGEGEPLVVTAPSGIVATPTGVAISGPADLSTPFVSLVSVYMALVEHVGAGATRMLFRTITTIGSAHFNGEPIEGLVQELVDIMQEGAGHAQLEGADPTPYIVTREELMGLAEEGVL